ncbi:extracellular solute-binding protein [Psychromicrobium xiongbiense]|uniref:extracellular solute-binding protein n=1 Tax=Psychromicrobium xiongbiense TaxID=3051184 RepID=UPI002552210F|nr:extracellular solute-binding protein [Psychromicrobium sp. YIM S02556]
MTGTSSTTSRRAFLGLAGLSTLLIGTTALTGCGQRTPDAPSNVNSVNLPKYTALKDFKPDIAGTADGVPAAFYSYPKPFKAVPTPPLSGQKFTVMTLLFGAVSNPRDSNPAWQEVEKRLGATVNITAVSSDDYGTKLNTQIAGGDLPDMMFNDGAAIPDIVSFVQAKCADLTPFLGGDKISAYPNLAAIPEVYWKACVTAGKIYFLPIPRGLTGGSGFYNATLLQQAGVSNTADIKDKDDFYTVLKALTKPDKNQWALGSTGFGLPTLHHIFKTPYVWRESGGKLTKDFETDEYQATLEYATKLYKDGLYAPGSDGWTKSQMVNAFTSGKVAIIYDGLPAYLGGSGYTRSLPKGNPSYKAMPFIPFGATGGKGQAWIDNVVVGTTMIKKADDAKVKDILTLANFLASPFGSEEYLLLNYGTEGSDYTLDSTGNPQATPTAQQHTGVPWKYLAAPQQAVYDPAGKDFVDIMHKTYETLIPSAVPNPCQYLFSPADAAQGSVLSKAVTDTVKGIIAGRQPMTDFKAAVDKWKQAGGDKIRAEYEKALADSKK